jgi:NTE family protein
LTVSARLPILSGLKTLAILSFLILFGANDAQAETSGAAVRRPRIALVLSGGAVRGFAHIGILKVLEENRIPVDFIAGTSMGAIVGGLYASGLSPDELDRIFTSTDWDDMITDRPARKYLSFRRKQDDLDSLIKIEMGWKNGLTLPSSLVAGDKLMFELRKRTLQAYAINNFDDLPVPFRAVATDVENGEMVVLTKGDLALALRASMAIPGLFAPQEIDGRLLVDGFLTQNLPVSVARGWGADIIIAVDVGAQLYKRSELKSIFRLTGQPLTMMSRKNTKEQIALLRPKDVLIQPDLGDIVDLDFGRAAKAISIGEQAAHRVLDSLRRYSISEQEYAAWRAAQRRPTSETVKIESVRIDNISLVPDKTIEKRVGITSGEEVKLDEFRQSLNRVYDLGAFDLVDFRLADESGRSNLIIKTRDKETGRISVRFGLKLFSDFDADSDFNFLTSITATELNRLGAEWKNQVQFGRTTFVYSEWYQPLEYGRTFFAAPYVKFLQDRVDGDLADGTLVQAKYRTYQGGLDAGAQLGSVGELRIGPVWGVTDVYELHGTTLPNGDTRFTQAGAHVRLLFDQIDNVNFPRDGYFSMLELYTSREAFGADLDYNRLAGSWIPAISLGDNTLLPGVMIGGKIGPDLPFYENFRLGGFLNLSGFPFQGLSDQYYGLARLIYYYRVLEFAHVVDGIYVGGSAETGGVWHEFDAIGVDGLILAGSVFVGLDTFFGPLYFAYGQAEGGNNAVYFYLGRGF